MFGVSVISHNHLSSAILIFSLVWQSWVFEDLATSYFLISFSSMFYERCHSSEIVLSRGWDMARGLHAYQRRPGKYCVLLDVASFWGMFILLSFSPVVFPALPSTLFIVRLLFGGFLTCLSLRVRRLLIPLPKNGLASVEAQAGRILDILLRRPALFFNHWFLKRWAFFLRDSDNVMNSLLCFLDEIVIYCALLDLS